MPIISQEEFFRGSDPKKARVTTPVGAFAPSQPVAPTASTDPSFASRVGADLQKRGDAYAATEGQNALSRGIQLAGAGAGFVNDVIGEGIKSAVGVLPQGVKDTAKNVAVDVLNTPLGQQGIQAIKGGIKAYGQFKQANPEIAGNLEAVLNIASLLPIGKGAELGAKGAVNLTKTAGTKAITGLEGVTGKAITKVGTVAKSALEGRDAKLLSIFSGESTDAVKSAIANPKIADVGIKNGDVALRQAVQKGSESSIKARTTFNQAYRDSFTQLVKDNPGVKIVPKQTILNQFQNSLIEQGVKFKGGKLDFTTSKIVTNPGEVSKINAAYKAIKGWKDFSVQGTNELKQLVGGLTKFANEAGGSSKSPFLGQYYNFLDTQIKNGLPKSARKTYTTMNTKYSDTIGMYDDMVDAFNSGDPFTKLANIFGTNKDTLRQVIDFYEKTTGNKISPIVAGRVLSEEKNAAFGFLNPRSWVDFFIPPKIQAGAVTGYGKLKSGVKTVK